MTSPIDRAEAELTRLDLCLPPRDRRPAALAVFESIDPDDLAQAIHDGPEAQKQYASNGIAPHSWADCIYREQYLNDAAAVKAWLTGKDQT